jgi:UDPglucose--hexose-1-phosphate uridylyltransferase
LPLERHELRHRDGRRLLVYGELRGSLADEPPSRADSAGVDPVAAGLHQRLDRLTGAWVAVSPARNRRPNQPTEAEIVAAGCPFCPGGPEVPFPYDAAVFENRFPSLVAAPSPVAADERLRPALGRCEVVLYTSRHEASLATLTTEELDRLMAVWRDRTTELWAEPRLRFVMVFENRGAAVGATIAHPHGQVYAFDHLPPNIERRVQALARAREATGRCLSCDVVADDLGEPERHVLDGGAFTVSVPFGARLPFEVHVRARRHGACRLEDLDDAEQRDLAQALQGVVGGYDALFAFELPYMMVALEGPPGTPDWHLAVEFLPLHRTTQLLKIRASVETATGLFINDTLPETSADRLRRAIEVATARGPGQTGPSAGQSTLRK